MKLVLGGGITGLAAGAAAGGHVIEKQAVMGGLCATYTKSGYRFEVGGGHWVWGADPMVRHLFDRVGGLKWYDRQSSVWLPELGQFVPYPLQLNLGWLPREIRGAALMEIADAAENRLPAVTLDQWLLLTFGRTLYGLFFGPFHELYVAGLAGDVAVEDPSKNPVDLHAVRVGAHAGPKITAAGGGYNPRFAYPAHPDGLLAMINELASRCHELSTRETVIRLDPGRRRVETDVRRYLVDGPVVSTLPLDVAARLAGAPTGSPDPVTGVVVVNIGATRVATTPTDHWVYVPSSRGGFHRVGFYSNVDSSFAPAGKVAVYVERAFAPGALLDSAGVPLEASGEWVSDVIAELQELGWIGEADYSDATYVRHAYAWRRPGSTWRERTIDLLGGIGVWQVGRYARWHTDAVGQSLVGNMVDGLRVGAALHVT